MAGAPKTWTIEVRDKQGYALSPAVTLTSPQFTAPAVKKKNEVGTFQFTLGLWDPQAVYCNPALGREIILKRDGTAWEAYRIWTHEVNGQTKTVTFGCFSLLDYFRDRYFDRGAQRINLLTNPNFETGSAGWSTAGSHITVATSSADHVTGAQCIKLTETVDDSGDTFYQDVDINNTSGSRSQGFHFISWAKINSWTGPNINNFGITVVQLNPSTGDVIQNAIDGGPATETTFQSFDLDWHTPRAQWVKGEVFTEVFPGVHATVRCAVYPPNGELLVDATWLAEDESATVLVSDQATIAGLIIFFAQDPANDKDNVLITTGVANAGTPPTGIIRTRSYQFADHINVLQALQEFTQLSDGMDMQITPDRIFHTYYIGSGGIGSDLTGSVTLTLGSNCEVTTHRFDGPNGGNDICTLGSGGGPGREEGGAHDSSVFGGLTVQQIIPSQSPDFHIDQLPGYANQQLAVFKRPVTMDLVVTDRDLGYTLGIGDRVTLAGTLGYLAESGTGRIVQISADLVTDLVTVTLNKVA